MFGFVVCCFSLPRNLAGNLIESTKVTCAKPAHTAPPLVQKKVVVANNAWSERKRMAEAIPFRWEITPCRHCAYVFGLLRQVSCCHHQGEAVEEADRGQTGQLLMRSCHCLGERLCAGLVASH